MKIINIDKIVKEKVNMEGARDAFKQMPISSRDGTPNFSFRVFTIEPNGHTPKHQHPFEHINYVISGEATLYSEEKGEQHVKSGDFALVLPNELHQYKNRSKKEPFVMICAVPKEYE